MALFWRRKKDMKDLDLGIEPPRLSQIPQDFGVFLSARTAHVLRLGRKLAHPCLQVGGVQMGVELILDGFLGVRAFLGKPNQGFLRMSRCRQEDQSKQKAGETRHGGRAADVR